MFSFHKPKIYRSNLGCCICKAKSSSSRFTDSKKYENEFERCFRIEEERSGEICNACVLLVKRWKKLSPENKLTKHWHHVVDARAGPGTKLTGNRRLNASSAHQSQSRANNESSGQKQGKQNRSLSASSSNHSSRADVLPLSSINQAANSQTSGQSSPNSTVGKRISSFNANKARAIDTNVSTFTFGEPQRRSYMTPESFSTSPHLAKPHSALNSSAFESVIKRFRQRQQQQQLEAQRRLLNRQQQRNKSQQQQQSPTADSGPNKRQLPQQMEDTNQQDLIMDELQTSCQPSKRVKRNSESIGSMSIDGFRISTILDSSIWRKEKVCCGIIFRGVQNEIAVFPKLLKPCQCKANARLRGHNQVVGSRQTVDEDSNQEEELFMQPVESPPPRTTKSGSISSCDSNTSGTGSMEQPLDAIAIKHRVPAKQRRKSTLLRQNLDEKTSPIRPNTIPGKKRKPNRRLCDTDSSASSNSSADRKNHLDSPAQAIHSPASSSGASSANLLLMVEDEDDEGSLDEDEVDSSADDASSSLDSLTGVEAKKGNAVGATG